MQLVSAAKSLVHLTRFLIETAIEPGGSSSSSRKAYRSPVARLQRSFTQSACAYYASGSRTTASERDHSS